MTSRRGFLRGLVGGAVIVAAPAIIREGYAMPVKAGLGKPEFKRQVAIGPGIYQDMPIDKYALESLRDCGDTYTTLIDKGDGTYYLTRADGTTVTFCNNPVKQYNYLTPGTLFARDFPEFDKQRLAAIEEEAAVFSGLKGDIIIDSREVFSPDQVEQAVMHERLYGRALIRIPHTDPPVHPKYTAGHGLLERQTLKQLRKRYPN